MEQMKEMFMKEIHEMNEKHQATELRMRNEMFGRKKSNLGDLQDDTDNERELLRQQREEVAMLKEQIQDQVVLHKALASIYIK